jgi:hypothetical protein
VIQPTVRWRRLLAFAGTAFVASFLFDYGYAQAWPMVEGLPLASASLLGMSWFFGLWRAPFRPLGIAWSLVVSLLMPFFAMIGLLAVLCYVGPECL